MAVRIFTLVRRIQPLWADAIMAGAKKHGIESSVYKGQSHQIREGDILFTWNRHGAEQDQIARQFEIRGGKVVCFENSYLKTNNDTKYVSVGLGYHNNIEYAPKCLDNGER